MVRRILQLNNNKVVMTIRMKYLVMVADVDYSANSELL